MAANTSQNPLVFDAAGQFIASTSSPIRVRKIRWASVTAAGALCRIEQEQTATTTNVFWQSVSNGAAYVEESDFSTSPQGWGTLLHGIRIASLTSGFLHIYID